MQEHTAPTALVPLADGYEEIEASTIVDVLRRGGVEVTTAAVGGSLDVRGAHGMGTRADALFAEVKDRDFDAIVLPGGGEGTDNLRKCSALLERIVRQREQRGLLAAVCAAPTVLSAAGVLSPNQHATCYPTCQLELDCPWINQPVVEHNGIVTGQAPGSAMLFSLVVLKVLVGEQVARKVARGMVFEF